MSNRAEARRLWKQFMKRTGRKISFTNYILYAMKLHEKTKRGNVD